VLNALRLIARGIDGLNEAIGRSVAWLSLLMVLVTFLVVVLRYGFHAGSIALQESVMYMYAFLFMLSAAYALKHDGHVRVDIIYNKLSTRAQAWVDLFGSLFFLLPTFLFIGFASFGYVSASWRLREGSPETGGLPYIYVLKSAILLLAALMVLQGLSQAIKALLVIAGRDTGALRHTREAQDQV